MYEDIGRIPVLPTLVFKEHRLFSLPRSRMLIKATSSGTKGKFSEIGFELSGLLCGLFMTLKICSLRKLISPIPCHYILLGYKPHKSNHTAVTKTAFASTLFAPALSRTFALIYKDGGYTADLEYVIRSIQKHGASKSPIRLKAGLICSPEKRAALTDSLIRCGVARITRAGSMSELFSGEAHDGDYPLRRYVRVVNVE